MFTSIGSFTFQTFTLYLSMAMICSVFIAAFRLRKTASLRAVTDCAIAMLIFGFLLARAEYVLLNPDIFESNTRGIYMMRPGGLDWHGALAGALLGLWLMAQVRNLSVNVLLGAFAPALPLIAFAGWTACRAIGCVYGTEVQTLAFYPAWMVTEGRDIFGIIAPRYDTHTFGQVLAWVLLVLLGVMWWRDIPRERSQVRLWLVITIFATGMLAISKVRGDFAPVVAGLRADQWLDLAVLALGVAMLWRNRT
jgi:prolipoprotein diacylglyceryltransferase